MGLIVWYPTTITRILAMNRSKHMFACCASMQVWMLKKKENKTNKKCAAGVISIYKRPCEMWYTFLYIHIWTECSIMEFETYIITLTNHLRHNGLNIEHNCIWLHNSKRSIVHRNRNKWKEKRKKTYVCWLCNQCNYAQSSSSSTHTHAHTLASQTKIITKKHTTTMKKKITEKLIDSVKVIQILCFFLSSSSLFSFFYHPIYRSRIGFYFYSTRFAVDLLHHLQLHTHAPKTYMNAHIHSIDLLFYSRNNRGLSYLTRIRTISSLNRIIYIYACICIYGSIWTYSYFVYIYILCFVLYFFMFFMLWYI